MVKTLSVPNVLVHKLILSYLKANDLSQTFLQFEQETSTSLEEYPQVVRGCRELVLAGKFDQAEEYLQNLQESIGESNVRECLAALRLQKYLEILEGNQNLSPAALHLARTSLDRLNEVAPSTLAKDVSSLLGLRSVVDHPSFRDWTILNGRSKAFQIIYSHLEPVESDILLGFWSSSETKLRFSFSIQRHVSILLFNGS